MKLGHCPPVLVGLLIVSCAACTRSGGTSSADSARGTTGSASSRSKDPCEPATLGLANAAPTLAWKPPQGCTLNGTSGANAKGEPTIIRSEQEFHRHFTCSGGAQTISGVDFARNDLAVVARTLSPAGMGFGSLDDGTKVTTVVRQRMPCPNDPRPMPMPYTQAYLLPARAERVFADVTCTVRSECR